ncbi:spermidine synthase [Nakamurella antarctica]|uniref:Spermidine synthase n=2 Tax=Nakamurella antarctica TaxID=1902245 RepID=A0A3G9A158_9ACTN|nr:spermidine synthase [Nakamurella antarctica]
MGVHRIDTGTCELLRDLDRERAYLLMINGMESSYIDLDDPWLLDFEYLRWMAAFIDDAIAPTEELRVVHLGAAGCTMVRYLLACRPGSQHVAVDIDAELLRLVTAWFALPAFPQLDVRIGDARSVTASLPDDSCDVIIRDVFAGPTTPTALTTVEFTELTRQKLRAGGMYLLNCADHPDLTLARKEASTVSSVFAHVAMCADPSMLKSRRRGNVVIVGSDNPIGGENLAQILLAGAVPAQLWQQDRVRAFGRGYAPLRDSSDGYSAKA